MKKIYLLTICCCLFGFSTQAQSVIFEQPPNGTEAFVSDYFNLGTPVGIYSADDFELVSATDIDSIKVYGGQDEGNLITAYLTGFSLYVYSDNNGIPMGDPTMPGTGLLEIINLPANSPDLQEEIIDDGDPTTDILYLFTIDITSILGTPLNLSAGKYWVVAFPHIDVNFDSTSGGSSKRWNWGSSTQSNLSDPHWIDPDDKFGLGATSWSSITSLDPTFKAFSFSIYGQNLAISTNQQVSQVSLYPNPFANVLNVNLPTSVVLESATMHGLYGKQIPMTIDKSNTLNTAKLVPGVYVLKLKTSKGILTRKVVKQ